MRYITLKKTRARSLGMNPVIECEELPLTFMGQLIYEGRKWVEMHECENCGQEDENTDNAPVELSDMIFTNGNFLIEYPKRSMTFWCPLCFIWNHNRKTVNRVLGSDPSLPHHDENAADEGGD